MWRDKNHRFWTFQNHGWWQLQLSWWHGTDIAGGWNLLVSNSWGTCKLRSRTVYKQLWKCVSSVCAAIGCDSLTLEVWDPGNCSCHAAPFEAGSFQFNRSVFENHLIFKRLVKSYICCWDSKLQSGAFAVQSGSVSHLKQEWGKCCACLEIQVRRGDEKSIPLKWRGEDA